jgi:hypothetical protein
LQPIHPGGITGPKQKRGQQSLEKKRVKAKYFIEPMRLILKNLKNKTLALYWGTSLKMSLLVIWGTPIDALISNLGHFIKMPLIKFN